MDKIKSLIIKRRGSGHATRFENPKYFVRASEGEWILEEANGEKHEILEQHVGTIFINFED